MSEKMGRGRYPPPRRTHMSSRAKRIAFIGPEFVFGGAERQLLRTALSLTDHGVEVLVVAMRPSDECEAVLALELANRPAALQITVIDSPSRIGRVRLARHAVQDFRPEVIVAWRKAAMVWASMLKMSCRVPVLRLAERNSWESYDRKWQAIISMTAKLADRVVANSEAAAQSWRSRVPNIDVRVTHNFAPPLEPIDRSIGDQVTLLLVGRLSRQKGIDVAIDALAIARSQGLDAKLVVVGRDVDGGHTLEELKQRAQTARVDDHVDWRPPTLHSVADARPWADVLLVPSRWEGQSNVVSEALACGMGVIATTAVVPPPGSDFARAPVDDAEALASLLVGRAWQDTLVDAQKWHEAEAEAHEEALSAWLDLS